MASQKGLMSMELVSYFSNSVEGGPHKFRPLAGMMTLKWLLR
jgi:hypothetical protein